MSIKFYKRVGNYLHYYVILAMPIYASIAKSFNGLLV